MNLIQHLSSEEQLLVRGANNVPAANVLLKAAAMQRDALQRMATKDVGTVPSVEIERYLIEAKALDSLVQLPSKISRQIHNQENEE